MITTIVVVIFPYAANFLNKAVKIIYDYPILYLTCFMEINLNSGIIVLEKS